MPTNAASASTIVAYSTTDNVISASPSQNRLAGELYRAIMS
jgi:hypothetical protein